MYVLQNWTFTPGGEGAGLIEIPGIFSIEEFALITNLTRNIPLFDPAEHEATIVLSENGTTTTLTLSQNTSFCSSTDELQIVLYDTNSGNEVGLTDTQLRATPVPVSVSGVATAANQSTANSSLSSIDGKLPAQVSGRVPVDIGSASVTITGPVTVSNEVEVKNDTGNPGPTAPDVQRGGGAITATTTRVTLATDGPGVAALSNIDGKTPSLINARAGVEPLGQPGVARQLAASSASANTALTTTCRRISVFARGADIRFAIGSTSQTASSTSHYIANGERLDLVVPATPNIAVIRAGSIDGTLEVSELV